MGVVRSAHAEISMFVRIVGIEGSQAAKDNPAESSKNGFSRYTYSSGKSDHSITHHRRLKSDLLLMVAYRR